MDDPSDEQFNRQPPHSLDAEQCLLASLILDRQLIDEVQRLIPDAAAFYSVDHELIYSTLLELDARSSPVDAVILRDALRKKGELEEVGGAAYIGTLLNLVPSAAHGLHYARIVAQKFILRKIFDASNQALRECFEPHTSADQVLERFEARALEVGQRRTIGLPVKISEITDGVLERMLDTERSKGIPTQFFELDDMLAGLHDGELILIAGRPGMGKSAAMLGIVEGVAVEQKIPCAIFSMEMSKESLTQRMICSNGEIDSQQARTGKIPAADRLKLAAATEAIHAAPIWVEDSSMNTVGAIRAASRRLKNQHGIRLILIDYLQLMDAPEVTESRQQQITAISRGVKSIARDLNIPVIALCQMNRTSETRDGNKPKLSGLRESGSLEQDADVVILLHRDDYYKQDDKDYIPDNMAEWIVAKQRNGPTGRVLMVWDGHKTKFRNLSKDYVAPAAYPDFV